MGQLNARPRPRPAPSPPHARDSAGSIPGLPASFLDFQSRANLQARANLPSLPRRGPFVFLNREPRRQTSPAPPPAINRDGRPTPHAPPLFNGHPRPRRRSSPPKVALAAAIARASPAAVGRLPPAAVGGQPRRRQRTPAPPPEHARSQLRPNARRPPLAATKPPFPSPSLQTSLVSVFLPRTVAGRGLGPNPASLSPDPAATLPDLVGALRLVALHAGAALAADDVEDLGPEECFRECADGAAAAGAVAPGLHGVEHGRIVEERVGGGAAAAARACCEVGLAGAGGGGCRADKGRRGGGEVEGAHSVGAGFAAACRGQAQPYAGVVEAGVRGRRSSRASSVRHACGRRRNGRVLRSSTGSPPSASSARGPSLLSSWRSCRKLEQNLCHLNQGTNCLKMRAE
ncbi:hypothetical protein PVAP13_5NG012545 [Panicum virgatum]|uniref:Uncharacterized protein n=1 Tax=Panicum virgatum TaxID=38727 RepID=A0A8T0S942_PANVG|nr:hypothetical protein PVAP13_5NG012545 [Panicum virgatum]